jgi:hypothetical protein
MEIDMQEQYILCPQCGKRIELTAAVSHEIEERLRKEFNQKYIFERNKLQEQLKKKTEQDHALEFQDLKNQLTEASEKLKKVQEDELEVRKRRRELEEREQKLDIEVEQKFDELKKKHENDVKLQVEQQFSVKLRDLENQLSEASEKLKKAQDDELELHKRRRELDEREQKLSLEARQKFDEQKAKFEENVRAQIEQQFAVQFRDLQNQLNEKSNKLQNAETQELETRKRLREVEERERALKLEVARKIDEERHKIWENATAKIADEHRLKDAEKDKQLNDLRRQIEELKRKAEQTSQQLQGEVLEIELENLLRNNFRHDDIEPVPKGIRGADVIQLVRNHTGELCGSIIWESKRTKNWQENWIQKLKDNQRESKANFGIIVSSALPKEINRIGMVDGVWVIDFSCVIGLSMALRAGLIETAQTKNAMIGKSEKIDLIYNYFTSQEFRQRVEAIVETFTSMKDDLEKEKRSIMTLWAKREKQLERVLRSTTGLYGDLQSIIGSSLQPIQILELPAGDQDLLSTPEEQGILELSNTNGFPALQSTTDAPITSSDIDKGLPF